MKVVTASVFVFLAVGALGASLYGEKEDAMQEVKTRFEELSKLGDKVITDIETEKSKDDSNGATAAIREGNTRKNETEKQFEKEVIDTTRSAIAKGKPLNTVECIAKTLVEGNKTIEETIKEHKAAVDAVKPHKDEILALAKMQVELIKKAADGLKEQSLESIKKADKGFQLLKADALKKVSSAENQLHEMERRVPRPSLSEEYSILRKRIGEKYKEIKDSLSKRLQKCLL